MPQTNIATAKPLNSVVLHELYDLLMAPINQELLFDNLKDIKKSRLGESQEDFQNRLDSYAPDFERFEQNFKKLVRLWSDEVQQAFKNFTKDLESLEETANASFLDILEQEISTQETSK